MEESKVIAIAGGSGVGKSTLTVRLCQEYPHVFRLLQFDDYAKPWNEFPLHEGLPNRAHPDSQRFDDFREDLRSLRSGHSVTVVTKSALYNPDFRDTKARIAATIEPAPLILAEGFLVLYDPTIRSLVDHSLYLDMPIERSMLRRDTVYKRNKPDPIYIQKVLEPMHRLHAVPTKEYADMVIDVSERTADEVHDFVLEWIRRLYPSLLPQ